MKILRLLGCAMLLVVAILPAQVPGLSTTGGDPVPRMSDAQLEQLVGPIALYPDALIALILPAATQPTDLVLAARHVRDHPNDLSQVEHRAWDDSVKSLTRYPEVLQWLDDNLPWTKELGDAFLAQPADVMNAIQRLRARARANGTLVDTPEQQILSEPSVIRIVPADPEIIYVPNYDPRIVFVDPPLYYTSHYYSAPWPLLTFTWGRRVGPWLAYDFDWQRCTLWVGDRHRNWHGRHDWRQPVVPVRPLVSAPVHAPAYASRPWQAPGRPQRPQPPPASVTPPRPHRPESPLTHTYARPQPGLRPTPPSTFTPRADSVTPPTPPPAHTSVFRGSTPATAHPRSVRPDASMTFTPNPAPATVSPRSPASPPTSDRRRPAARADSTPRGQPSQVPTVNSLPMTGTFGAAPATVAPAPAPVRQRSAPEGSGASQRGSSRPAHHSPESRRSDPPRAAPAAAPAPAPAAAAAAAPASTPAPQPVSRRGGDSRTHQAID